MKKNKSVVIIVMIVILLLAAVYYFVSKNSVKDTEQAVALCDYAIEDPFVTNVKDSEKLFKTTIILVADEEGMDEFLEKNQYTVRDTILFILRNLTEEDIESEDIEDTLRQTIPEALNNALKTDSIVSVCFSDFVMQ